MESSNQEQPQQAFEAFEVTEQPYEKPAFAKIVLAAIAASAAGAVVWAAITYFTNYELGIAAWGIGAWVGAMVAYVAKKRVEQPHQVVAVVFGLAGVLAGKYLSYYLSVKKAESESGMSLDGLISFKDTFDGLDLLWIVLAGAAAWTIPKRMGNRN